MVSVNRSAWAGAALALTTLISGAADAKSPHAAANATSGARFDLVCQTKSKISGNEMERRFSIDLTKHTYCELGYCVLGAQPITSVTESQIVFDDEVMGDGSIYISRVTGSYYKIDKDSKGKASGTCRKQPFTVTEVHQKF